MTEMERAAVVESATVLHRVLMEHSDRVDTAAADYRAMVQLNSAIVEAIRALTGDDPAWMRLYTGWPFGGA
ncbi:hypothetical protein J5N58_07045 [Rhizobium cremeum]|uniref:hypothetical protein n=1 Tax=Rhizobium cremeum TaxID=2813827 RepID=UPI001FD57538|nr:hypothetical protein [Rhizobium cremeum]MCJ7996708.1 hypothetical protein [Rhizobium cremeum]MCJ7999432.1 hypothetical protein [Rhizobium cremeum]